MLVINVCCNDNKALTKGLEKGRGWLCYVKSHLQLQCKLLDFFAK